MNKEFNNVTNAILNATLEVLINDYIHNSLCTSYNSSIKNDYFKSNKSNIPNVDLILRDSSTFRTNYNIDFNIVEITPEEFIEKCNYSKYVSDDIDLKDYFYKFENKIKLPTPVLFDSISSTTSENNIMIPGNALSVLAAKEYGIKTIPVINIVKSYFTK